MSLKKRAPSVWWNAIVLFTVCLIIFLHIDWVPQGAVTRGAGTKLAIHLLTYARAHDELPASLAELAKADPATTRWLKDEWGRPFSYTIEPDSIVVIESLGRDGKQGGERNNADLTWRVRLKNVNGNWIDVNDASDLSHWVADIIAH